MQATHLSHPGHFGLNRYAHPHLTPHTWQHGQALLARGIRGTRGHHVASALQQAASGPPVSNHACHLPVQRCHPLCCARLWQAALRRLLRSSQAVAGEPQASRLLQSGERQLAALAARGLAPCRAAGAARHLRAGVPAAGPAGRGRSRGVGRARRRQAASQALPGGGRCCRCRISKQLSQHQALACGQVRHAVLRLVGHLKQLLPRRRRQLGGRGGRAERAQQLRGQLQPAHARRRQPPNKRLHCCLLLLRCGRRVAARRLPLAASARGPGGGRAQQRRGRCERRAGRLLRRAQQASQHAQQLCCLLLCTLLLPAAARGGQQGQATPRGGSGAGGPPLVPPAAARAAAVGVPLLLFLIRCILRCGGPSGGTLGLNA